MRFGTLIGTALLAVGILAGTAPFASAQQTPQPAPQKPQKVLFVQSAGQGTLVPVKGSQNELVLILRDVTPSTLWFTDRPARESGSVATEDAITRIGFDNNSPGSSDGPPNAVLSLQDSTEAHDMLAVTLRNPKYDATAKTLQYSVTKLPDVTNASLPVPVQQLDTSLPRKFGHATLFIDDVVGDYPITVEFRFKVLRGNTKVTITPVGGYCVRNGDGATFSSRDPISKFLTVTIRNGSDCAFLPSNAMWRVQMVYEDGFASANFLVTLRQLEAGVPFHLACQYASGPGFYCDSAYYVVGIQARRG
jgi:hypothetical protein